MNSTRVKAAAALLGIAAIGGGVVAVKQFGSLQTADLESRNTVVGIGMASTESVAQASDGEDSPAGEEPISYNRQIRPILANSCLTCHGPDAGSREAELRLDTFEGATAPREGGPAIVPGDPEASELIRRVRSDDPDLAMPPATVQTHDHEEALGVSASYDRLEPEQIALLERWIEQGAEYEEHWAFLPPQRPELPEVRQDDWPLNPIDRFVLAKLESEGVSPSPEADRVTLLRRVTLDLTGLPPTPEEVQAFLADEEPGAYERAVDRLLASEAYGERMAVHWLDQVRYADSTGYHSDEFYPVWAYRDYVIRAFNANMPFDRFTREQLAGDLLEDPTQDQKIASAFNRLNQTTAEGGAQAKEYLAMYMADRIDATANAFMGATMGCAQCHDHKYDPYTIRNYYEFGAFFADIDEPGVYSHEDLRPPHLEFADPQYKEDMEWLESQFQDAQQYVVLEEGERESFDAWHEELRDRVEELQVEQVWLEDQAVEANEHSPGWNYVSEGEGQVYSGEVARRQSGEAETVQHFFLGAEEPMAVPEEGALFYAYVWLDPDDPPQSVMLQFHTQHWEHRAFWGEDRIEFGGIGQDTPGHRPMGELPETGQWVRLEVPASRVDLKGQDVVGMAFTQFGGTAYWDQAGLQTYDAEELPLEVSMAARGSYDELDEDSQHLLVREYRRETDPDEVFEQRWQELVRLQEEFEQLQEKAVHQTVVTEPREEPRQTRVLPRGNWMDDSGEVVQPRVPGFLGELAVEGRADRENLARWLLSEQNPLLGRAVTNRFWSLFFGHGISRTPDELGTQGAWPTHPRLLDWLATEFRESGWDVKHIVRLIVTSRTYRQSSQPRPELAETDPDNELLARQNRFRLEAEFVRDNALAAAGLLNRQMYGPPIKPYQPPDYWRHLNFPRRTYEHSSGPDQWRRGVYIHWQRTFLHPMLRAFDAPSRERPVAQRDRSNTPLQSLTLLNDPTFVEAARTLGQRMLQRSEAEPEARIAWGFRRALAREPEPAELAQLRQVLQAQREHYRQHPQEARELLTVGIREPDPDLAPTELAAWTAVARTILNLHETITRY